MMENQEITPEQTVDIANKALAENKTLRAMLADTAEKIANLELRNSELKVQSKALQEVLASINGTVQTEEE
jgi:hypothetical protein|tara:strand:+ start:223 stop:435 length:213 start_codon:yes stop_codon:yes gene_type:complete